MKYEGIYRKNGSTSRLNELISLFESEDYNRIDLENHNDLDAIASVTDLLKYYFDKLPEPLITSTLYGDFIEATRPSHFYHLVDFL